ncbi:MAG: PEP-CTERM sorting domain-containing protein [Alphaproteobacteria bacterium]|nr:PEP-CTERM sorting domain-containing protein [Alphaproteobacteria bacterium]
MRIKSALLGTAAAITMLAGASGANAAVHALASLDLSGLVATGLPAFNTFLFTGSSSVFLTNGIFLSDADLAPPVLAAFSPGDAAGPLDSAVSFVKTLGSGAAEPANNAFTPIGAGAGLDSYSYADQIVTYTKINATTGTPGGGSAWKQIAETLVTGGLSGNASTSNTQVWNFAIALSSTVTVDATSSQDVPEPATLGLLGLGGASVLRRRRAH